MASVTGFTKKNLTFANAVLSGTFIGDTDFCDTHPCPRGGWATIYGRNIGAAKGTITVGSTTISGADIIVWDNDHNRMPNGALPEFLNGKIQFKVPTNADLTATTVSITPDGESATNTLPFAVKDGPIRFVDPVTGDNSDDGTTEALAWADYSNIEAGGEPIGLTVYLRGATYTHQMRALGLDALLYIGDKQLSNSSNTMAICSYPDELAILDGGNTTNKRCIYMPDQLSSHILISGLKLMNLTGATTATGISVSQATGNNDHYRYVGNELENIDPINTAGMACDSCSDFVGSCNYIHDGGLDAQKQSHAGLYHGGFRINNSVIWRYNSFYNLRGGPVNQLFGHSGTEELTGFEFYGNVGEDLAYNLLNIGTSDGSDDDWVKDVKIFLNFCRNSGDPNLTTGITNESNQTAGVIRVAGTGCDAEIFNNTFIECINGIQVDLSVTTTIENNIFEDMAGLTGNGGFAVHEGTSVGSRGTVTIDDNLINTIGQANEFDTFTDTDTTDDDPLHDSEYRLGASSPAIDNGKAVTGVPAHLFPDTTTPNQGADQEAE